MSEWTANATEWRMRVLVVEDDVQAARALDHLLRAAGHETDLAHDGLTALRAAENNHPDVVLLDIGLPGLGGWELAAQLQALPADKRPLLVAVTGYDQEEDRRRSLEAGIDLHLTKPVDAGKLQHLLQRFRSFVSPVDEG
jgi:two-component system OmpR family response regulator